MPTIVPFATAQANVQTPAQAFQKTRSAAQLNHSTPAPAAKGPQFGAYIPVACEVICGLCCLIPVAVVAAFAFFGGKKKTA
jgi:hypothetical protein